MPSCENCGIVFSERSMAFHRKACLDHRRPLTSTALGLGKAEEAPLDDEETATTLRLSLIKAQQEIAHWKDTAAALTTKLREQEEFEQIRTEFEAQLRRSGLLALTQLDIEAQLRRIDQEKAVLRAGVAHYYPSSFSTLHSVASAPHPTHSTQTPVSTEDIVTRVVHGTFFVENPPSVPVVVREADLFRM